MPHAVIEYSANIEQRIKQADLVPRVHQAMLESGLFGPDSVKTRAFGFTDYCVGQALRDGSFYSLKCFDPDRAYP